VKFGYDPELHAYLILLKIEEISRKNQTRAKSREKCVRQLTHKRSLSLICLKDAVQLLVSDKRIQNYNSKEMAVLKLLHLETDEVLVG